MMDQFAALGVLINAAKNTGPTYTDSQIEDAATALRAHLWAPTTDVDTFAQLDVDIQAHHEDTQSGAVESWILIVEPAPDASPVVITTSRGLRYLHARGILEAAREAIPRGLWS